MKKAVELASAAAELGSQLRDRQPYQVRGGQCLEYLSYMVLSADVPNTATARVVKFSAQNGRRNAQQLAAVTETEMRRDIRQQPMTFAREARAGGIQPGMFEILHDALQEAHLIDGKERKQVFKARREAAKHHLAAVGTQECAADRPIEHKQIAGREAITERS